MTRIIKPMICGAIIGGLGLTIGARSIVDYLDVGNRPAYEAVQPHLQQIQDLKDQKLPFYNRVGDKVMSVRSALNTGGRVAPKELEDLAYTLRSSEESIARIDDKILLVRHSPEYKAYEAENAGVNKDVSLFRYTAMFESGLLLLGAGIAHIFSRRLK